MPRIRHTSGPGRFGHSSLSGVSGRGDDHDVGDEEAAYLCDELCYFERVDDVVDPGEEEYEDVSDHNPDEGLEGMTYDELREQASEADIDGRSDMDKAELIDALGGE